MPRPDETAAELKPTSVGPKILPMLLFLISCPKGNWIASKI
jgi:hypothetical protein